MSESIENRVKKVVVEQLVVKEDDVVLGAAFVENLGADSLDAVELVMAFEEEFDIEILDVDAAKLLTVGSVVEYIKKRIC